MLLQTETSVYYNISTVSFAHAGDYNCSVKYNGAVSDVSTSYVISGESELRKVWKVKEFHKNN